MCVCVKGFKGLFDTKALNERVHLIAKSPRGRRSNREVSFSCPTLLPAQGSSSFSAWKQSRHRVDLMASPLGFVVVSRTLSPLPTLFFENNLRWWSSSWFHVFLTVIAITHRLDDDYTLTRRTHATFVYPPIVDTRSRFKPHVHWQ